MSSCGSSECKKRNVSRVQIQCFYCKKNFHAECLEFESELSGAANIGQTMMRYPGLIYMCKECRSEESVSIKDAMEVLYTKVDDLRDEINQLKTSNVNNSESWSSIVKKCNEKTTSESVLIIEPMNDDEKIKSSELKKELKKKLKDEDFDIINTRPTRDKNGLIVICENLEAKIKVQKAIQKKMPNIYAHCVNSKLPRIKILNVETDDVEKEIEIIGEKMYKKLVDKNDVQHIFEHVATIPVKYKGKICADRYNLIFSADPSLYKDIMNTKRIKVGFAQCKVVDGAHITRCFKCFGFFHKSNECPKKNEKMCMKCCGFDHKMTECTSELKCINCAEINENNKSKNFEKIDENHSVFDKKCHCYQKAFKSFSRYMYA